MSKRAEELALAAYPKKDRLNEKGTGRFDPNFPRRKAYQEGYEQAEKDLALTWEDIDAILTIFEGMKDRIINEHLDDETLCKEILKRFNELRDERTKDSNQAPAESL